MHIRTLAAALAVLGASAFVPAHAATFNIAYASPHAPLAVWNRTVKEFYFVEVNKRLQPLGHRINFTDTYGGTVVKFGSEVDSLQKGLADMCMIGAIFNQARLPLHLVGYAAPFSNSSLMSAVTVMDELTASNAALRKMWDDAGLVPMASIGIESLDLFTKKPAARLADIKGQKIGGVGINLTWLKGSGAVPVVNTPDKVYSDIQTGVIDGQLYLPTLALVGKVHEVAPHMLKAQFGSAVWGSLAISKKVMAGFPPEVQKVLRDVGAEYTIKTAEALDAMATGGVQAMQKAGMKVTTLDAAARKEWADALPDLAREWAEPLEAKGLPAKQLLAEYMAALRKKGETPLRDWAVK